MTVEELIELLQKEDSWKQVRLHFTRYTPVRTRSRATRPVSYPVEHILAPATFSEIYLVADQQGDYY